MRHCAFNRTEAARVGRARQRRKREVITWSKKFLPFSFVPESLPFWWHLLGGRVGPSCFTEPRDIKRGQENERKERRNQQTTHDRERHRSPEHCGCNGDHPENS